MTGEVNSGGIGTLGCSGCFAAIEAGSLTEFLQPRIEDPLSLSYVVSLLMEMRRMGAHNPAKEYLETALAGTPIERMDEPPAPQGTYVGITVASPGLAHCGGVHNCVVNGVDGPQHPYWLS